MASNYTTVEAVKNTVPDTFEDVADATIQQYISDSHLKVTHDSFATSDPDILEQAERYLTIHRYIIGTSSTLVSTEKVGPIQVSYFKAGSQDWLKWLQLTTWGADYYRLWSMYGDNGMPRISLAVLPQ
ncbi:DUF4054 domain-containing protein [Lentilactobacillus sunkii]|uniref:DUF4054 domain-containing protein n=1 Tax=Lentilactobacillus sunkii DSM 19904 TaxID=1423808 RepID=A0A0R1L5C2_9LACO|nr:DUF4054 domain-containing protein [Lentilactobacillus sunkii]KRK87562.1 hypothetical protein FD17_GL000961 [Lentilactobacillus sunkii DSM 19904]